MGSNNSSTTQEKSEGVITGVVKEKSRKKQKQKRTSKTSNERTNTKDDIKKFPIRKDESVSIKHKEALIKRNKNDANDNYPKINKKGDEQKIKPNIDKQNNNNTNENYSRNNKKGDKQKRKQNIDEQGQSTKVEIKKSDKIKHNETQIKRSNNDANENNPRKQRRRNKRSKKGDKQKIKQYTDEFDQKTKISSETEIISNDVPTFETIQENVTLKSVEPEQNKISVIQEDDITIKKRDSLNKINQVKIEIAELSKEMYVFSGSETDKEYIYFDEMLTRTFLKLDNIDTYNDKDIRSIRREVIKLNHSTLAVLKNKVEEYNRKMVAIDEDYLKMKTEK